MIEESVKINSKYVASFISKFDASFDISDEVATSTLVHNYLKRSFSKSPVKERTLRFVKILSRNAKFDAIASESGLLATIWHKSVIAKIVSKDECLLDIALGIICNSMQLVKGCPVDDLKSEAGMIFEYSTNVFCLNLLRTICNFLFLAVCMKHYEVKSHDLSYIQPFMNHVKNLLSCMCMKNKFSNTVQVDHDIFSNKFSKAYDFSISTNIKLGMEVLSSSFFLIYCVTQEYPDLIINSSFIASLGFRVFINAGYLLPVVSDTSLIKSYCQMVCNILSFMYSVGPADNFLVDQFCPKIHSGFFGSKLKKLEGYSTEFYGRDVTSIISLRYVLDQIVNSYFSENQGQSFFGTRSTSFDDFILKYAIGTILLCSHIKFFRKYLRFHIFPPLTNIYVRPEKENSVRGKLVTLLTSTKYSVSNTISELLYIICKKNKNRLIKYCGMANCMGFLNLRGLLKSGDNDIEESSSDNSETDEYINNKGKINIMIGCLDEEKSIEDITEEEKDEQYDQLMRDIDLLNELNVINPAFIDDEGRIVEKKK